LPDRFAGLPPRNFTGPPPGQGLSRPRLDGTWEGGSRGGRVTGAGLFPLGLQELRFKMADGAMDKEGWPNRFWHGRVAGRPFTLEGLHRPRLFGAASPS
jgi:hypothetical protein